MGSMIEQVIERMFYYKEGQCTAAGRIFDIIYLVFSSLFSLFLVFQKTKKNPESLEQQDFRDLVEEGGFEPPKRNATDLQSAPFGHSGTPPSIRLLELVDGFEPPTC